MPASKNIMTIYYAHCLTLYNTLQEGRNMVTIRRLFGSNAIIVNPNCTTVEGQAAKVVGDDRMVTVFRPLVERCDVLVFRSAPSGRITSGVAIELEWAVELGKLILELPSALTRRRMGIIETREYLAEVGQR